MPLYEYQCGRCGKRFELIQKFSAPPEATCVACGGTAHRQLSAPALQFKGSGWYVTDYARKPAPEAGAAKSAGGSDGSGAADKPAADNKASTAAEKNS